MALFFSNLADSIQQKLSRRKNKFEIETTETLTSRFEMGELIFFTRWRITSVVKILKNLNVAKASGIDHISVEFLKDGAPVIAIHLRS